MEEAQFSCPDSSVHAVLYNRTVDCIFQIAQRKIHENLSNLENINKQYRRLAREGRTDTAGTLKSLMQDANDRWDLLQGQMSAILRQLKHSSSIREDFKKTKEALLSWLTEIDMQLTNLDQLSSMDVQTKLREMDVSTPYHKVATTDDGLVDMQLTNLDQLSSMDVCRYCHVS